MSSLQQWDINEKLPAEVEGPFHVAVATNVLHTGNNLKSESQFHRSTPQILISLWRGLLGYMVKHLHA